VHARFTDNFLNQDAVRELFGNGLCGFNGSSFRSFFGNGLGFSFSFSDLGILEDIEGKSLVSSESLVDKEFVSGSRLS
jgi:hypothetical protein